jgi:Immunity protein 26
MSWSPLDDATPSDESVLGDEPFDLISDCLAEVTRIYERDWNRKPSLREIVGTVQAVLEAQLQDLASDGHSAELMSLTFKKRRIPKRQNFTAGDILRAEAGNDEQVYARIFDIHPQIGPFVGVYDSLGMPQESIDAIIQRPLVVKVFPTHREVLERREWVVIGNRPLTQADDQLPRGPVQIGGSNQHLEAVNYYYGLGPKTFYNIDDCLARPKSGG